MATNAFAGPVDYLVFVFDEHADIGAGLAAILERVEQGIVEILDIELIARDSAGSPLLRSFDEIENVTGIDRSVFAGVDSGILDAEDRATIAAELGDRQFALAVIYEDRSLAAAASKWAEAGGVELFSGGIDVNELDKALEEGNQA